MEAKVKITKERTLFVGELTKDKIKEVIDTLDFGKVVEVVIKSEQIIIKEVEIK